METAAAREVVITGIGLVSPIGIGRDAFWESLRTGRSGVHTIDAFVQSGMPIPFGAEIPDFDGKQYVTVLSGLGGVYSQRGGPVSLTLTRVGMRLRPPHRPQRSTGVSR